MLNPEKQYPLREEVLPRRGPAQGRYAAGAAEAAPRKTSAKLKLVELLSLDKATLLPIGAFICIAFAYVLFGLIGHDPWKQDETYIFGIVHNMLTSGDWVVPAYAGEPFMEKPPLYYWVAAICARLFSPMLALHDGARLASGLFMAITAGATGWTARHWWGPGHGRYAVLALFACIGTVWYSHLMLTDIPVLCGFALACSSFVCARRQPLKGGVLLGLGIGIGFLGKGVLAPGCIGAAAVALLPFREWRTRNYLKSLLIAGAVAAPWLFVWPALLYSRSPELFKEWFWVNNVGRFVGFSVPALGAPHTDGFWLHTLPWVAFPALPLMVISAWKMRRCLLEHPAWQTGLLLIGALGGVLWVSASARPNYVLPLLAPMCILAAPAALLMSSKVEAGLDWTARILFGSVAAFIWGVWLHMQASGRPLPIGWLSKYLPADFTPVFQPLAFVLAAAATVGALFGYAHLKSIRGRSLTGWVMGMGLCWTLLFTLWLPWIDYAKSYRGVFLTMQDKLPPAGHCVASAGLGESERAMLRYVLGLSTKRMELTHADCGFLLVNGRTQAPPEFLADKSWQLIWDGARPGDGKEHFWLFRAR